MTQNILKNLKEKNRFGFLLLIGTVCLASIVFIINLLRSNIDTDWFSWLFYIPSSFGHAFLFLFCLYIIFYLPFTFIFKSYKIPAAIFIFMAIILQILLVLDGFVFNLYRFHINGFVVEMVLHGGREIFVFDIRLYIMFALLIIFSVIIPYALIIWLSKRYYKKIKRKIIVVMSSIFIICILFSHIAHSFASAFRQTSIQRAGTLLPYFFPLTMNSLLEKMGIVNPDEIDKLFQEVSASDISYPKNTIIFGDSTPQYNILFIAIDSWNPRTLDSLTMPYLYSLTSKYQYFTNHLSSSNGTRGSVFGFFYGLPYTYETDFLTTKTSPILIDVLVAQNYAIQAFPGGPLPNNPYHEVMFKKAPHVNSRTEGASPFERDQKITQLAINHINENKDSKPFFTFVFYDLPHAIALPKEYIKFQPAWTEANYMILNNNTDPTPFFNLYRNCVHQVDQQIQILLEHLDNYGLMKNTIVIITGDHGQEFNENHKNYWGHNGNFSQWQIHVPFLMYEPHTEQSKRFSHITTHYDIAPTLMKRYLGVKNPTADYSMGFDICDTVCRFPHIVGDHVNYGFVFENFIVTTRHLGDMLITDKELNELPRNAINVSELKKMIDKKNMFYKKTLK